MFTIKNDTLKKINGGNSGHSDDVMQRLTDYYGSQFLHRTHSANSTVFGLMTSLAYNNDTSEAERAYFDALVTKMLNGAPNSTHDFLLAVHQGAPSAMFPAISALSVPAIASNVSSNSTEV